MSIDLRFVHTVGSFTLDIATTLPSHGFIAISGASGSGKTTLLRLLAGLETATKGDVTVNQRRWQDDSVSLPVAQRHVGYLSQIPALFPHLNAQQNIDYANKRRKHGASLYHDDMAELLAISACLPRYPSALSGGEKQRVALARMLAAAPKIMLLDEAFTGIERDRRFAIIAALKALAHRHEIPILYVTHNAEEIQQFADTTLYLSAGRIQSTPPLTNHSFNATITNIKPIEQQLEITVRLDQTEAAQILQSGCPVQLIHQITHT